MSKTLDSLSGMTTTGVGSGMPSSDLGINSERNEIGSGESIHLNDTGWVSGVTTVLNGTSSSSSVTATSLSSNPEAFRAIPRRSLLNSGPGFDASPTLTPRNPYLLLIFTIEGVVTNQLMTMFVIMDSCIVTGWRLLVALVMTPEKTCCFFWIP